MKLRWQGNGGGNRDPNGAGVGVSCGVEIPRRITIASNSISVAKGVLSDQPMTLRLIKSMTTAK